MSIRRSLWDGRLRLLLTALVFAAGPLAARDDDGFLRQFAETDQFRHGRPASIRVTPKGDAVLFLRTGSRSFVRDLYHFDPATGRERVLLAAEALLGGEVEELSAEEKARRERARLSARGIASFSLSEDGERILAPLGGRLFLVRWRSGEVRELAVRAGVPLDPRLSPDGRKVAYVVGGDLYAFDLDRDTETRLTEGGGGDITHGLAEFVAQEEMDRREGYWWSPDSRALAFQRNDDRALETFSILDPSDPATPPQSWKYPRAGRANTDVQLGIVSVTGERRAWVTWDRAEHPYLATVHWNRHGPLTLVVQNRHQTEELVLTVDTESGGSRELWRELDPAWLNLRQGFPRWLPDGRGWLWATERSGEWQVELRDAAGRFVRNLVPAGVRFQGLIEVTDRELWIGASTSPLDRAVWRVPLDGGPAIRLTAEVGCFDAGVAEDGSLAVLTEQPPSGRWRFPVIGRDGGSRGEIVSVAEVPAFPLTSEWLEVGENPGFFAVLHRPPESLPGRKLPVILRVYGGPTSQKVTRDGASYFLDQWLANQGYAVVWIDGRGTPGRGRAFERAIHRDLIGPPLADQVATLGALGRLHPELDLERVGVYGWSFGGYFAAMATLRHPEIFRAGVAGAPVCDWEDYDTHYTERYLGLPQEQAEAYRRTSLRTYAAQLERPLLVIHGTADDNVYLMHGLKLSQALFAAGRRHEFLPLVGQTHIVVEPDVVERLYGRIVDFFAEHLGGPHR